MNAPKQFHLTIDFNDDICAAQRPFTVENSRFRVLSGCPQHMVVFNIG